MAPLFALPVLTSASYLSYADTKRFSPLVLQYIKDPAAFADFISHAPDYAGIEAAIKARRAFSTDRKGLYEELLRQYGNEEIPTAVQQNLKALRSENTFTICTAHQPAIFTGALYFVYKIIHAAKLAADLKTHFPDCDFVPVFYIGSEDNDLEELGHFQLGKDAFQWDGGGQTGAVGRMKTDGLKTLLNTVLKRIGPPGNNAEMLAEMLQNAYRPSRTVAEATRILVTQLLGDFGLVVIDGDSSFFKGEMKAVFEDDLFRHTPFELVKAQTEKLSACYSVQAFPRPINLFYLADGIRQRIEKVDKHWEVMGTDIRWNEVQLRTLLEENPENFSPNVVLRGLYQETILPNISFIGGGAEVAYWMQFKTLFEHYEVPFPVIVLRQSVQWIDAPAAALLEKTELDEKALFEDAEILLREYTKTHATEGLSLDSARREIAAQLAPVLSHAAVLDKSLQAYGEAQQLRAQKLIDHIEQKIFRAEKKKHGVWHERVLRLQEKLLLHKGLQERKVTFLDFYPILGKAFAETLFDHTRTFGDAFLLLKTDASLF